MVLDIVSYQNIIDVESISPPHTSEKKKDSKKRKVEEVRVFEEIVDVSELEKKLREKPKASIFCSPTERMKTIETEKERGASL